MKNDFCGLGSIDGRDPRDVVLPILFCAVLANLVEEQKRPILVGALQQSTKDGES